MMLANNEKPRWSFYAIWIILTSLCIPVALFISLGILRIIINIAGSYIYVDGVRHITEDYLAMRVFVPVVGLLTGVLQYGLLRRHLPRMGWWVLATLGGWLLGVLLIDIPIWMNWAHGPLNLDLAFILMGLAIGAGQWLLVRRRLPRAGWWIGANVVGWGLVSLITVGNALEQYGLLALGFLPACATAAALAYLMSLVKPAQPNAAST
jgi:hypothetical protein